ncbi:MAG TPA: glycosyltransferase family 2 protein [Candidatus Wujingus californicus]|uniref:glycosyltransferase family 2 protein n=1 Tax=Candidatus Wujingus californicus TaxID=3367618 RepID=UPI0040284653
MKKISIIIPLYNASTTIRNCILSVIQTRYPLLEVIVVDDASTEESPRVVEDLCQKYPEIIKLIRLETNSGPAKARNVGAVSAKGDYLFFLDSDTVVLPDIFDNFVSRMNHADAVVGIYHYESLNKGCAQNYKALLNNYFFSRKGVIKYEVFDAARAGIKADIFHRIGGFNEHLRWGMDYENEELGYRLFKSYKILLDPSIVVRHVFPNLRKLTKTYFCRVALWMEIFFFRKKFEFGGVTSPETGLCTFALIMTILTIPFIFINSYFGLISLIFFSFYLYGYFGFLCFVFKRKPSFLLTAFLLNLYFSLVICSGASYGVFRVLMNSRSVKERIKDLL